MLVKYQLSAAIQCRRDGENMVQMSVFALSTVSGVSTMASLCNFFFVLSNDTIIKMLTRNSPDL